MVRGHHPKPGSDRERRSALVDGLSLAHLSHRLSVHRALKTHDDDDDDDGSSLCLSWITVQVHVLTYFDGKINLVLGGQGSMLPNP